MISRSTQIRLRRMIARWKLRKVSEVWPILNSAGRPPDAWKGWPNDKKFAFILSHDVESEVGLANVKSVAEIEMRHGCRSCFNLVPEGTYSVPLALRNWLTDNGFEVGIHDLCHDGRLYSSRRQFRECAQRINQYLKEWNVVGFRSGFMLHNLEWLHDLNTLYDSSTFDTDPFEPNPDGVGTIFPFWVSEVQGGRGYVELPYTLPQDLNLFIMLEEQNINIWKRKLDWIVAKGGMAFLDTHPDYMAFDGSQPRVDQYPVRLYEELLAYVNSRYRDLFWHPLPREVAQFCAQAPR